MSLEMCILASGSAANCAVVRTPAGVMLIDAGLGPRATALRLAGAGVDAGGIAAICLTHLDYDHFRASWVGKILKQGIRVFCHESRRSDLLRLVRDSLRTAGGEVDMEKVRGFAKQLRVFDSGPFTPLPGLTATPIAFAHDEAGSHGFVLCGHRGKVGYATDLGRPTRELVEHFQGLNIVALESNYDPQMQMESPRPQHLKRRIMGGRGHLSNEQAFETVRRILDAAELRGAPLPAHIVLLHRSRECNCPDLLRTLFSQDERIACRLTLAEQEKATEWLRFTPGPPEVGEQLVLAWT